MNPAVRTTLAATLFAVLSAAALVAMARPAHAAGGADIRFVEPERFSDAGWMALQRERTLAELAAHLRQLAQRLPDGQELRVEVLDVDLAGETVMRAGTETRVLRGRADMPRVHLKWTLAQGAAVIRSGDDRLVDLDYLPGGRVAASPTEDLPYEKRLLTRWFEAQVQGR